MTLGEYLQNRLKMQYSAEVSMLYILICSAIIGRDMSLFKVHLFKFIYAMPMVSAL